MAWIMVVCWRLELTSKEKWGFESDLDTNIYVCDDGAMEGPARARDIDWELDFVAWWIRKYKILFNQSLAEKYKIACQ